MGKIKILIELYGKKCWYCKKKLGPKRIITIDHIIPRIKGGDDELNNLLLACKSCNTAKKDKDYEEFIKWRKEKRPLLKQEQRNRLRRVKYHISKMIKKDEIKK